jgi:hypothetical protein
LDPDLFGQIQIRIQTSGIWILAIVNDPTSTFLGCGKAINTSRSLLFNFLVDEYTFKDIFSSKKFPEKSWPKLHLGQDTELDPDPDLDDFKSRIRSKIVRIPNTASLNLYLRQL